MVRSSKLLRMMNGRKYMQMRWWKMCKNIGALRVKKERDEAEDETEVIHDEICSP